ncbi:PREDICTED: uncharacterized protein LOC109213220 [Nicotiana attenuata]|uniref:uncharacterized protein LOC109213220 n=1 Tax=Nicotiana attenuata TaxID=49451 RepID=UPI0009054700|nr:PREDICTED: uncharacterized protein LOC109213220 [Nicotiana attenuata]
MAANDVNNFFNIGYNDPAGRFENLSFVLWPTSQAGGEAQTLAARTPVQRVQVDQVLEIIPIQPVIPDSFIKAHAGARKVQARKVDIFRIAQGESEQLREFVIRFQKERMFFPVVPYEWEAKAFVKGLNPLSSDASNKLKESLIEDDQVSSSVSSKGSNCDRNQERFKADVDTDQRSSRGFFQSYERADGQGNKGFRSSHRFSSNRRMDRCRSRRTLQEKEASGSRDLMYLRLSDYNFNISLVVLVSAMRNVKEARTRDCRHLREEVAALLKNGHLRELLGDRAKNNYGKNHDARELTKPVVGSPLMGINMIFGGSSANIIQWRILEQAKLTGNIVPVTKLLDGFNLTSVMIRGEIFLPTHVEGVTKTTMFEVVDGDMGYDVILGRPWIHEMKVLPSTYHQLLKISTPEGVKLIRRDQLDAREINTITLSSSKGKEIIKWQPQEPVPSSTPVKDNRKEESSHSY